MKPVIVGNLGGFGKSVRFRVMMTEAGWRVVQRILSELEGATPSACNPYCEAGVSSPKLFLEQDQSQIQRPCELNNTERTRVGRTPNKHNLPVQSLLLLCYQFYQNSFLVWFNAF